MKKITLLCLVSWILIAPSYCQEDSPTKESFDKNILKINLTGLFLKNYGFQYERMLGRKTSIALGVRTQPKGELPLLGFLENQIDDLETFSDSETSAMVILQLHRKSDFTLVRRVDRSVFTSPPTLAIPNPK
nr:hypothetical protein [Cytophagales bacterium]